MSDIVNDGTVTVEPTPPEEIAQPTPEERIAELRATVDTLLALLEG